MMVFNGRINGGKHQPIRCWTVSTYLEAYFQVFTELRAAAHFTVQALVDEAVQLIRAVAAVVLMVTQQRLIDTVSIFARVGRVVAFFLWFMEEDKNLPVLKPTSKLQMSHPYIYTNEYFPACCRATDGSETFGLIC